MVEATETLQIMSVHPCQVTGVKTCSGLSNYPTWWIDVQAEEAGTNAWPEPAYATPRQARYAGWRPQREVPSPHWVWSDLARSRPCVLQTSGVPCCELNDMRRLLTSRRRSLRLSDYGRVAAGAGSAATSTSPVAVTGRAGTTTYASGRSWAARCSAA